MNIKKVIVISTIMVFVVLSAVLLFLTVHNNSIGQQEVQKTYADISEMQESSDDSQNYWSGHDFARGDGGYYFQSIYGDFLMYFDAQTKEIMPVCDKPECQHNDTGCNAYLGKGAYLLNSVYYYRGYIYLLKQADGNAVLEQVNADGSGRKDIATVFPSSGGNSIELTFQGDYVYAYDKLGHKNQNVQADEVIKKISLDGNSQEVVYKYTGTNAAIDKVKSFGSELFFTVEDSVYNAQSQTISLNGKGLYAYNDKTKETGLVIDADVYDYYVDNQQNILYYYVTGEGLYKMDIGTEEKELIFQADGTTGKCSMSYDGRYLYLSNILWCTEMAKVSYDNKKCIVMKTDGTIVNTIACSDCLEIYFGDGDYMFAVRVGNGAPNGLSYIDKKQIETVTQWSRISEKGIDLIHPY